MELKIERKISENGKISILINEDPIQKGSLLNEKIYSKLFPGANICTFQYADEAGLFPGSLFDDNPPRITWGDFRIKNSRSVLGDNAHINYVDFSIEEISKRIKKRILWVQEEIAKLKKKEESKTIVFSQFKDCAFYDENIDKFEGCPNLNYSNSEECQSECTDCIYRLDTVKKVLKKYIR